MQYELVVRELVKTLRGPRSQAALSRWLGFRTNVVYTWECGRSEPSVVQLFQLAAKTGTDPKQALGRFYRRAPAWLETASTLDREHVANLLEQERGGIPMLQIARETGVSRHSLARYLRAEADMRLSDLLRVLDYCSRRLLDFLALWVDVSLLPSVAAAWERQALARRTAYDRPWSHAVLRCLELADNERGALSAAMISERLGVGQEEVDSCLQLLQKSGQVKRRGKRWVTDPTQSVDLSADREASKELASWWLHVAAERSRGQRGMFAYNLCSVSAEDLQRIASLQRDCLRQIRAIVADSKPAERVAVVAVQVFGLDGDRASY